MANGALGEIMLWAQLLRRDPLEQTPSGSQLVDAFPTPTAACYVVSDDLTWHVIVVCKV